MTRRSLIVLAVVCGLAPAAPALKDKPDSQSIVGEWERVSYLPWNGRIVEDTSGLRLVFSAEGEWSFSYRAGQAGPEGMTFVADPTQTLPTVDIYSHNGTETERRGIYKIDGETLTICFAMGDTERPKKFESSREKGSTIWTLKRVKPKD